MKIEYISHACLSIETGDLKIVTDPWFNGGAYCNQWHVFPRPVNTEKLFEADVILLSHGHEDHLHEPTLKLLPKNAWVFYPYYFFGGGKEFIQSMGFDRVTEAVTYKKYRLNAKTSVTYLINSHDSIMVIESGGKVLVNANDALHSYPAKVIDFYLEEIKNKWKEIDVVFCGFGGASYFPNTMHLAGKNDRETGILREQLFAHNFCRVVAGLKPKVAVPFAADFALLGNHQRWINETRFPRSKMAEYYRQNFGSSDYKPLIYDMYSGDSLENLELKTDSPYRKEMREGELNHLLDEQYEREITETQKQNRLSEAEAEKLTEEIRSNVEKRMRLFKPEKLQRLNFNLEITDVPDRNFFQISFADGKPEISRAVAPADNSLLTMKMNSKILRYSLESDWGADVISIGYGAEIYISDKRAAEVDLENVCMNLLACYPTPRETLKKSPYRTLQFMLANPTRYTRSLRKLKKFNMESDNYDRKVWLLQKTEEIRKNYNLPKLDDKFIPTT